MEEGEGNSPCRILVRLCCNGSLPRYPAKTIRQWIYTVRNTVTHVPVSNGVESSSEAVVLTT